MTKIRIHNPVLGVPITFLNYHNPEQFDIIWQASGNSWANGKQILEDLGFDPTIKYGGGLGSGIINKKAVYTRLLIKKI